MQRIESFLSARLFLRPQLVEERIFFLSNMSGHISLYAMDIGGSVPEPLLPPQIALQNPHLIDGKSFFVFPKLEKVLVMIDRDGDENYQPMLIPIDGGFPEPAFDNFFGENRSHLLSCDADNSIVYLSSESRTQPVNDAYQANLATGALTKMASSSWGARTLAADSNHSKTIILDSYTVGDDVLYLWMRGDKERRLLYGTPLELRDKEYQNPLSNFSTAEFCSDHSILISTSLFEDTGGLGYVDIRKSSELKAVAITGTQHTGHGEFETLVHLIDNRYLLRYNIDGSTWSYEAEFDESKLEMEIRYLICGEGVLSAGVLEAIEYDRSGDRFILAFSTATSPTQIYTIEGEDRSSLKRHTSERILGIRSDWLSPGEDASFTSFDGTRVSARMYLPPSSLGFTGPRPLVYYIHGGPQGQERPDFAWFSMPLIQFLTLNGFAVFVPNVRGSTGYGLSYTKQVDRDWGGKDRLDHVHAMTVVLKEDPRVDVTRSGVVGRSYGGYMTLTLAGRHPDLWKAAVDMFGPYDLLTFMDRIPETWKPYFKVALGDPSVPEDQEFLTERSPSTHIFQLECPLLVIQGKNDPRVVEHESRDLVTNLRASGKQVDYLMFENEGHDVLKYENRVACYNAITDYFKRYLM